MPSKHEAFYQIPSRNWKIKGDGGCLPSNELSVYNLKDTQVMREGWCLRVSSFHYRYNKATLKAGLFKLLIVN